MLDAVRRDVDPRDFRARYHLRKFVKEESFAATDIENVGSRLELVVARHGFGDGPPTPVVLIPAITILAVAVPVILAKPGGHVGAFRLVGFVHARHVVTLRGLVHLHDEIDVCHGIAALVRYGLC